MASKTYQIQQAGAVPSAQIEQQSIIIDSITGHQVATVITYRDGGHEVMITGPKGNIDVEGVMSPEGFSGIVAAWNGKKEMHAHVEAGCIQSLHEGVYAYADSDKVLGAGKLETLNTIAAQFGEETHIRGVIADLASAGATQASSVSAADAVLPSNAAGDVAAVLNKPLGFCSK